MASVVMPQSQDAVVAALHGQMYMVADVGPGGHGVDDFVRDVLRMRGAKTHAEGGGDGGHLLQQLRKVHILKEI